MTTPARDLTDVYTRMSEHDRVLLEKHAQVKLAEAEEDAAGRIMARGFADELTKLAADTGGNFGGPTETIKSAPMSTGGGATGGGFGMQKKKTAVPPAGPNLSQGKGTAGPGGTFTQGGQKFDATTSQKAK